jgi:hypothetical protein
MYPCDYSEWLVQPDTLCDSSDCIPGIMGGHLPASDHALSDFALSTDATGLLLNCTHLELNTSLFAEAESKAQLLAQNSFGAA